MRATAEIVIAFLNAKPVPMAALSSLITNVHGSLREMKHDKPNQTPFDTSHAEIVSLLAYSGASRPGIPM
jgi:predicted transcriptional regulator